MKVSQIKVGDVLIRENDHLDRPDAKYTVIHKSTTGKVSFTLTGEGGYTTHLYGDQLSLQNYSIIERDGVRIGTFCVRYW